MSRYTLPRHVDALKASKRGAQISGIIQVGQLFRLAPMLDSSLGEVSVNMQFDRDEVGRNLVEIEASCDLALACQRCLEIIEIDVLCRTRLALILPEDKGDYLALPDGLEPLLISEPCDTWEAVEDELILAIPFYPIHPDGQCNMPSLPFSNINFAELDEENSVKPFSNLSKLLLNNLCKGENYGSSKK